jgi:hypothetical protein
MMLRCCVATITRAPISTGSVCERHDTPDSTPSLRFAPRAETFQWISHAAHKSAMATAQAG